MLYFPYAFAGIFLGGAAGGIGGLLCKRHAGNSWLVLAFAVCMLAILTLAYGGAGINPLLGGISTLAVLCFCAPPHRRKAAGVAGFVLMVCALVLAEQSVEMGMDRAIDRATREYAAAEAAILEANPGPVAAAVTSVYLPCMRGRVFASGYRLPIRAAVVDRSRCEALTRTEFQSDRRPALDQALAQLRSAGEDTSQALLRDMSVLMPVPGKE